MERVIFLRGAACACVMAVVLTGCGTGASALSSDPAVSQMSHQGSWMRPDITSNLVYIALGSNIGVYSFTGKQVGELKGFDDSFSDCSDAQGDVWVSYGAGFLEYAHGGTYPIAQLFLPGNSAPINCAVDPSTGDVAATERSESQGENVAVFQNIYSTPQIYKDSDLVDYEFLGYDDQGNLFVNGIGAKKKVLLAELTNGGINLSTIKVDRGFHEVGGLQWDGQYLAIGDSGNRVIYQMSVADGQATTQSTTHFHGWHAKFKDVVPFAVQSGVVVFAFKSTQVGFWDFPQGDRTLRRIPVSAGGDGVAISVSASVPVGGER